MAGRKPKEEGKVKTSSFIDNLLKDEQFYLASEGVSSATVTSYIDTGSYTLNAALSASLFGGMADNRILALAGKTDYRKDIFYAQSY